MGNSQKKQLTLPQSITVKRSESEPEAVDVIAAAIIDIAEAFKRLEKSKAKQDLIVLLISDMTKLGRGHVRLVLNAAPRLAEHWLKRQA